MDAPLRLLQAIERALRASYPSHRPRIQGRSVNIGFSGTEIDYDIVTAFAPMWTGAAGTEPPYYEIPDRRVSTWIKAVKHWNRAHGKPLSGFHIEVMSYSAFWSKPDDRDGAIARWRSLLGDSFR